MTEMARRYAMEQLQTQFTELQEFRAKFKDHPSVKTFRNLSGKSLNANEQKQVIQAIVDLFGDPNINIADIILKLSTL